jgi:signal transduction histidine kinase/CheY-like chemotaxis protein
MVSREVVIANEASKDPRAGGLPPGHPPLESFLGLPVFNGLEMVGLVGIANRSDGYSQDLVNELDPYLAACSSMITARREAERRRQIEEELRQARDRAEAASRAKSDFLAMMSHEIRTPMNGVLGMAGMLRSTHLDNRQKEMVDMVLQSGAALVSIIDDILDFAKIEAGQLELREQDVVIEDLVEGVADLLYQEAFSKGIELVTIIDPALPDVILGDAGRLRQVLLNLVGNAVKFTDKGHITVRAMNLEDGIEFRVVDTGIGISLSATDRLFKPFSQLDSSLSRRFGGTGLGLAICKRLVVAMGGEMGLSSKPGKGSQFWFRVPLVTKARHRAARPRPTAKQQHVWIGHESPRLRECIRSSLSGLKVELHEIKRARLAQTLSQLSGEDDMLIVSAAWMKSMSGKRVARRPVRLILLNASDDNGPPPVQDAQVITLPAHRKALRQAVCSVSKSKKHQATAPNRPQLGLRVLVAEDNRVNARLACLLLETLGCESTVAVNGKDAVAAFQRHQFDAILMDCQMPVMDGHAATRKIRQLERRQGTSGTRCEIIAMTASALPEERQRCIDSGMDEHLSKPFDSDTLADMLAGISRNSHSDSKANSLPATKAAGHFDQLVRQIGREEAVQLAQIWLEESSARMQRITKALKKDDLESARKEAHTLRGASSVFGMDALVDGCRALESAVKSRQKVSRRLEDSIKGQLHLASITLRHILAAS